MRLTKEREEEIRQGVESVAELSSDWIVIKWVSELLCELDAVRAAKELAVRDGIKYAAKYETAEVEHRAMCRRLDHERLGAQELDHQLSLALTGLQAVKEELADEKKRSEAYRTHNTHNTYYTEKGWAVELRKELEEARGELTVVKEELRHSRENGEKWRATWAKELDTIQHALGCAAGQEVETAQRMKRQEAEARQQCDKYRVLNIALQQRFVSFLASLGCQDGEEDRLHPE